MPAIYARWIWGIFYRFANNLSIYAHLLNLTDQHWIFTQIYRKTAALESKFFGGNGAST